MEAHVVIGANYGDEGKGLMTDYLCRQVAPNFVVRINGGAQAGHTVRTSEGTRHVFSHFGSGTLCGVPTYLSRFFVCNPILCLAELDKLYSLGCEPILYADPTALVTTPWDMLINQALETRRGDGRHGSCGVGFNETIERTFRGFGLKAGDMLRVDLSAILDRIGTTWVELRAHELGIEAPAFSEEMRDRFLSDCRQFGALVNVAEVRLLSSKKLIFEGAQGLLLDQNAVGFPHVTRSNTGIINAVRILRACGGIHRLHAVYVTRSYLTRHGAGPLDNEQERPDWLDDCTNLPHPFQGSLRYAAMRWADLIGRVSKDASLAVGVDVDHSIALTWADSPIAPPEIPIAFAAYGDRAIDVSERRLKSARRIA